MEVKPVPKSLKRSTVTRAQFEERERQIANIRRANDRILRSRGINLGGTIGRTESQIIRGISSRNIIKQLPAASQRNVRRAFLVQSLRDGRISIDEFRQREKIINSETKKISKKQRRSRQIQSIRRARSNAAISEEKRLLELEELKRENKIKKIVETGKQNEKVGNTITSELGKTPELKRASLTRVPIERRSNNPQDELLALQQVNRPLFEKVNANAPVIAGGFKQKVPVTLKQDPNAISVIPGGKDLFSNTVVQRPSISPLLEFGPQPPSTPSKIKQPETVPTIAVVGLNSVGEPVKQQKPITVTDGIVSVENFFGLAPVKPIRDIGKAIDKELELDKHPRDRSAEGRLIIGKKGGNALESFELPSNQLLAGVAAPAANIGAHVFDLGSAILKGPQGFTSKKTSDNPLGFPVPKVQTPLQETAVSQLINTGKVDTKDTFIRGTAFGDAIILGAGVFGVRGGVGPKSPKTPVKPATSAKVAKTSSGKNVGFGPNSNIQLRAPPPKGMFADDLARINTKKFGNRKISLGTSLIKIPKENQFTSKKIGLGPGITKTPKKSGVGSGSSLFGKTGSTTKPKSNNSVDNLLGKNDRITGSGNGLQQIVKVKPQQKFKSTQVSLGKTNIKPKVNAKTKTKTIPRTTQRTRQRSRSSLLGQSQKTKTKQSQKELLAKRQNQIVSPITTTGVISGQKSNATTAQIFGRSNNFRTTRSRPFIFAPITKTATRESLPRGPAGIPRGFGGRGSKNFFFVPKRGIRKVRSSTAISTNINEKILPGQFLRVGRNAFRDLDRAQAKSDKKRRKTKSQRTSVSKALFG